MSLFGTILKNPKSAEGYLDLGPAFGKARVKMREFYLIRHGETDWNKRLGKLQGHTDIPLNDIGFLQAAALTDLTRDLNITKIISSDLSRAVETAKRVSPVPADIETHPDLREVHLGVGEGMTWDEINLKLGPDFRPLWASKSEDHLDLRFPGGESRREVLARVQSCLIHFLNKYPHDRLAFVSHGYVIRTLVFHTSSLSENFFVPNCAIVPFSLVDNRITYKGPETTEQLIQPRIEL